MITIYSEPEFQPLLMAKVGIDGMMPGSPIRLQPRFEPTGDPGTAKSRVGRLLPGGK